ncbi:MAG: hypothetical protein ABSG75_15090 [Syntrophales bacterium]
MESVRNVELALFVVVAADDHGVAGEVLIGVEVGEIRDVGLDEDWQAPVQRLLRKPRRLGGVLRLPPLECQAHCPEEIVLQGEVAHVDKPGRAVITDLVEESRPPPQADDGRLADLDPSERQDVADGA